LYGDLNSIRAVANAIGKNPIMLFTPCHRVVGSNGSMTGYAGGIEKKKWLLEHEGVSIQKTLDL
jgi:methylated-DNA-[protein]-cysteine S-methyltransferase